MVLSLGLWGDGFLPAPVIEQAADTREGTARRGQADLVKARLTASSSIEVGRRHASRKASPD
ncbi:hypothetical protein D3C86_1191630 [compost metagenome]